MFNRNEISLHEHKEWFRSLGNRTRAFVFVEDGLPIGYVSLKNIHGNVFSWGIYVSPESVRGTGTHVAVHSLKSIFQDMGIRKVNADILDTNIKSIGLHEKIGFVREGKIRDGFFDGENYRDVYKYGLYPKELADI